MSGNEEHTSLLRARFKLLQHKCLAPTWVKKTAKINFHCVLQSCAIVWDVQLVVLQNVSGICSDKTDADRGIKIINVFLESRKLIPHWSHQMHFSNSSFYHWHYLSFSNMRCLSHTFSLGLSAILLSSCLYPFHIKCCLMYERLSLNNQIPLRTVLISKVTPIRNYYVEVAE